MFHRDIGGLILALFVIGIPLYGIYFMGDLWLAVNKHDESLAMVSSAGRTGTGLFISPTQIISASSKVKEGGRLLVIVDGKTVEGTITARDRELGVVLIEIQDYSHSTPAVVKRHTPDLHEKSKGVGFISGWALGYKAEYIGQDGALNIYKTPGQFMRPSPSFHQARGGIMLNSEGDIVGIVTSSYHGKRLWYVNATENSRLLKFIEKHKR